MRNNRFTNLCLILIVALLAIIAFRRETPTVQAQTPNRSWKTIQVKEYNFDTQLAKETSVGWEPVVATTWMDSTGNGPQCFLILKR
jgi:hypothetical protein